MEKKERRVFTVFREGCDLSVAYYNFTCSHTYIHTESSFGLLLTSLILEHKGPLCDIKGKTSHALLRWSLTQTRAPLF